MKICNSIVVGCRGWSNCSRSDSQFVQCVLWVLYNRQVLYNRHNEMHTWQYFAASSIFADWGITFYSQKCHVRKMTTNVRKHHTTCIFWTKFISKMLRKIQQQHLLRNNTTNSLLCDIYGHYFFQSTDAMVKKSLLWCRGPTKPTCRVSNFILNIHSLTFNN